MSRMRLLLLIGIGVFVNGNVGFSQSPDAITYEIRFPDREKNLATIQATFPTAGKASMEWMMPIWSPGFYRVEDHAGKVKELTANAADGSTLNVEKPKRNRWKVDTNGTKSVTIKYVLECKGRSISTNSVGKDYAILNGPATFLTPVGEGKRPCEIKLNLPVDWPHSATGLPAGEKEHTYRASDYDTLADSPIAAGKLDIHPFEVAGAPLSLAAFGEYAGWDAKRVVGDVSKIVQECHRQWGVLPFKKYVFLLAFRGGGGGLEHLNSTLVTTNAAMLKSERGYPSFLSLMSHEFVHAYNVKRLRPVELGPFDYEKEPITASLWISEGLTSYYGDLVLARSGLLKSDAYLGRLSGQITQLQNSPGRLEQSLEQSSREVWSNSLSGVGANAKTVSYYIKGEVAGFVLDAKIRKATKGAKSLDDVMNLAFRRYSGAKGFTPEEFRKAAEEVTGVDLQSWYASSIASPGEMDYDEALDWYGLNLTKTDGKGERKTWKLEPKSDASGEQKKQLAAWLRQESAK